MRAGIAPCGAGIDSGLFDSSAGGSGFMTTRAFR
jgi:hypothetical protein